MVPVKVRDYDGHFPIHPGVVISQVSHQERHVKVVMKKAGQHGPELNMRYGRLLGPIRVWVAQPPEII